MTDKRVGYGLDTFHFTFPSDESGTWLTKDEAIVLLREGTVETQDGIVTASDGPFRIRMTAVERGGEGSGYHAPHHGRPGEVGGSLPRGEDTEAASEYPPEVGPAAAYPVAGETVSGLRVGEGIPNLSSIEASLNEWEEAKGIREVRFSDFPLLGEGSPTFYSREERLRTEALADQIRREGSVKPLIVVLDEEGPYVLEGGHRFDALRLLGVPSFPALIVIDREALPAPIERGGPGSGHFGHRGRPGEVGGSLPSGIKIGEPFEGYAAKHPHLAKANILGYKALEGGLKEEEVPAASIGEGMEFTAANAAEGRTPWQKVQIRNADRGLRWAEFSAGERGSERWGTDLSKFDVDAEAEIAVSCYDYMFDYLSDPGNADIIRAMDRDGENMVSMAQRIQEQIARGDMGMRGTGMSFQVVFTTQKESIGAGSGGEGGAKVFWQPLTLAPQDFQGGFGDWMTLGLSGPYVMFHELHHGYGSHSELDVFSNFMAADYLLSNPDVMAMQNLRPAVDDVLTGLTLTGATMRRRDDLGRECRETDRLALGLIYSRHPDYMEETFSNSVAYRAGVTGAPRTPYISEQNAENIRRWSRQTDSIIRKIEDFRTKARGY